MSDKPGTFQKGDSRINRKGRPVSFDAARELAQQIAHEVAQQNGQDIIINGHKVTVIEAILRSWATSKNPQLQQAFVWYAYGKPPERQEHTGADGGAIVFIDETNRNTTTDSTPRANDD